MTRIIGHGTWYDKVASEIVVREISLNRSLDLVKAESGLGASGFPHIGSLADATRSYAVCLALEEQGYKSELIAFSDDKDGLRKVPANLPSSLNKYLGYPVSSIPDPFNCHKSYGTHMSSLLLDALDACGVQYKFMSGTEVYQKGILNKAIKTLLMNAEKVGEIIKKESGQEKYVETLPYFPICSNCGRIYTTKSYDFLPKENKILYVCEGMDVKGHRIEGCSHKDEIDIRLGEGKLSWKVEFAARWATLGISFEAYGKDISDSVRINDRICREILDFDPPLHVQYEMFLDKNGKKISKSTGNVLTPQVWLRYGSPQSLLLLTLKRFVGTRTISVMDIPQYMDEFDDLEDVFFERKIISNSKEKAKLSGLYKYCMMMKPPSEPNIHIPYNLLVYLVKVAPKGLETSFVLSKLERYGISNIDQSIKDLEMRINYAINWKNDFVDITSKKVKLEKKEISAISSFVRILQNPMTSEQLQGEIFKTARKNNLSPKQFFKLIYKILIGSTEGPRLGPYIELMGQENVIKALDSAISS